MPEKITPKRTKLPAKALGGSNFPNDEFTARIKQGIVATFGSPLMELAQKIGLSVGLTDWYSDWALANAELARRLESGNANEGRHPAALDTQAISAPIPGIIQSRSSRRQAEEAISIDGQVIAVKGRITVDSILRSD